MLYDGLILYDSSKSIDQSIVARFPDDIQNELLFKQIPFLSIPDSMKVPNTNINSIVYSFNVENIICYNWAFIYKNVPYALIIFSDQFFPSIFMELMRETSKALLDDSQDNNPECRFIYLQCLLKAFSQKNNIVEIKLPFSTEIYDISKPCSYIGQELSMSLFLKLDRIWNVILEGGTVIVYSEDISIVTGAVLDILSLFQPLKFSDEFIIFTQPSDPLYQDPEKLKTMKVIGYVTRSGDPPPALPSSDDPNGSVFSLCLSDSQTFSGTASEKTYKDKMNYIIEGLEEIDNDALMNDPYYDFLLHIIPIEYNSSSGIYFRNITGISSFRKSKTYWNWRLTKRNDANQRSAFLSVPPEEAVGKLKDDELSKAHECVSKYKETVPRDIHLISVLNQHLLLIEKRQKEAKV